MTRLEAARMSAVPAWQDAIRARCVHPSGAITPFPASAIAQSIPSRFAEQVAAGPDRLAVKHGARALTYAELDRAANRVAQALLRALGDAAEPVPLLLAHGADPVIAMLGVLKAGKFFAPLDRDHPVALRAAMAADLEARAVLTHGAVRASAGEIAAATGARVIDVDALDPAAPAEDPRLDLTADSLAYVMYTSGTTGPPKGALENHRNVLQMTSAFVHDFHPGPRDRLTMLFRSSFSGSVYDLFGALLNGAALVAYDVRRDGVAGLADWLVREQVTMYASVPSIFRALIAAGTGPARFPHVRVVRFVGDRVLRSDVDAFQRVFAPECVMRLGYGATEFRIATNFLLEGATPFAGDTVPVGYVAEGRDVLLLDAHGRAPDRDADGGIPPGEIAIRSPYLSLGYWRRPELTAAKFVPDPDGGPERVYLTGDLGRIAPDGALVLLGRKDSQAKVRGQLVDVDMVEAALVRHDGIAHAAVMPRGDRLVAYVVPSGRPLPPPGELRRVLAQLLPSHAVPSTFVALDALPVTSTGKIDRAALPDPGRVRPAMLPPLVAPRTPVEAAVAAIWAEVLEVDAVGVLDDFLDLGGHSLSAAQIAHRVLHSLQADVSVPDLMEAATVAAMAVAVVQRRATMLGADAVSRFLGDDPGAPGRAPEGGAAAATPRRPAGRRTPRAS